MPKVTVIIPIYNVARYINRCARSLFEQSLDGIELLFVNDCSPDNSVEIIERIIEEYQLRFAEKNSVARIIKMESNSGQAAVRRKGIVEATGDYVIHCDGDDWVDTDLYEKMYNEAISSGADVVICPICDEYRNKSKIRRCKHIPKMCNDVLKNWWHESVGMFCWNKLVRRRIYIENELEPYKGIDMWEDNGLMFRVFYYAKGLSFIDSSTYHYNQTNVNALTHSYSREKIDQMISCANLIDQFFKDKHDGYLYRKTVMTLKYLAKLNLVNSKFDWLNEFYGVFPESNVARQWISLDAFSFKGKIRFIFVKYHLAWMFVLIFKLSDCFRKRQHI